MRFSDGTGRPGLTERRERRRSLPGWSGLLAYSLGTEWQVDRSNKNGEAALIVVGEQLQ
jgi:hypothetical protein